MNRILIGLAGLLLALQMPTGTGAQTQDGESEPGHHVLLLSSGEMPVAGAALHLAIMAAKSERQIDVLLLANALDLGRNGASGPEFASYELDGPAMLRQAIDAGATVSVCRICLENQGIELADMSGDIVSINSFEVLDLLETADVVLSFGAGAAVPSIMIEENSDASPPPPTVEACDPATDIDECM